MTFKNARISSSARPVVEYSSAHLPAGSKLSLQRQFGTAHVWKTVRSLAGTSGTESAPKVPMGRYKYRITVHKGRETVTHSASKYLYSYATVPLENLCAEGSPDVIFRDQNGCSPSTVQVGASVFTYLMLNQPAEVPNYTTGIQFTVKTSCRSISLLWALGSNSVTSDSADVEVVQSSADPQSASTAYGQIGSTTFSLNGGPWDLDLSVTGTDSPDQFTNATLSCWSATALT